MTWDAFTWSCQGDFCERSDHLTCLTLAFGVGLVATALAVLPPALLEVKRQSRVFRYESFRQWSKTFRFYQPVDSP